MRTITPILPLLLASVPVLPVEAQTIPSAPVYETPTVVSATPHDPSAYTEGLFMRAGRLWESTGEEGSSEIRETDVATGRVLRRVAVPDRAYGEGSVDVGDEILSLTWKAGVGYRWDARTLGIKGTFRYRGEGWALTRMGKDVVMSDGTPFLRIVDPAAFRERRRIRVTLDGRPVERLNEIEWVDGEIWANVWLEDAIVRIDPASGRVVGVIDLSPISRLQPSSDPDAVANGIAWDPKGRRLLVTGKRWTATYRITVPSLRR